LKIRAYVDVVGALALDAVGALDVVEVALDAVEVALDAVEVALDAVEVALDAAEVALAALAVSVVLAVGAALFDHKKVSL
jgi:hypothetical protein